jgi:glycosyltransferase involved in cell wall biosynthesis
MHICLIIDEERLGREQVLIQRLATGLIEREVRLTAVGPEDPDGPFLPEDTTGSDALERISIAARIAPWMRRGEARRVAQLMEGDPPDLIYAIGEQSWRLGLDVARTLQRPVIFAIWSAELVARVPHSGADVHVEGYIVPSEPIAEAVRQRVDPELVSVVPTGVIPPREPRNILADPESCVAIAIIGSGQDVGAYRGLLTALSRLVREFPQIQACLELRGPHEHEIWRMASRLELLGNVSAIVDAAMHRALLTGCDLLVSPERLGQVRSIVLQAMANGMPVVASADPYLDMLIPDETAVVVSPPEPAMWVRALSQLISSPEAARGLGGSSRTWVSSNHKLSTHVDALRQAFDQVVSGGAHTFAES